MVRQELEHLELYGYTDPASGKVAVRKTRARQAIVMIGVDYLTRVFVLFTWAGRLPTDKYKEKILNTYDTFQKSGNLRRFGIEANAMQELFGDLVVVEAKRRWGKAKFVGVNLSTKVEKNFRIRTILQPVISDGRLFVLEEHVELWGELQGFPLAATKDLAESVATAYSLVPRKGKVARRNTEAERLAEYLRNTGAPSWYIQEKMQGMQTKEVRENVTISSESAVSGG